MLRAQKLAKYAQHAVVERDVSELQHSQAGFHFPERSRCGGSNESMCEDGLWQLEVCRAFDRRENARGRRVPRSMFGVSGRVIRWCSA